MGNTCGKNLIKEVRKKILKRKCIVVYKIGKFGGCRSDKRECYWKSTNGSCKHCLHFIYEKELDYSEPKKICEKLRDQTCPKSENEVVGGTYSVSLEIEFQTTVARHWKLVWYSIFIIHLLVYLIGTDTKDRQIVTQQSNVCNQG